MGGFHDLYGCIPFMAKWGLVSAARICQCFSQTTTKRLLSLEELNPDSIINVSLSLSPHLHATIYDIPVTLIKRTSFSVEGVHVLIKDRRDRSSQLKTQ